MAIVDIAAKDRWRERFLAGMEDDMPWSDLEEKIASLCPEADGPDRFSLAAMLRIYCMQQWFGYSECEMADALARMPVVRRFAGLGLRHTDPTPDAAAIGRFAVLLAARGLGGVADPASFRRPG